jgi:hypothetical protein
MSLEINGYLGVLKVKCSQVVRQNFFIASCRFGFHDKFRVPLTNVLIDDQELKISIWSIIKEFLICQPILRKWILFQETTVLESDLPINVYGSWCSWSPITALRSTRALKSARLLGHEVS